MNERLILIGGEILEWSDLDPASGPPAMSGPVAIPLIRSLLSGTERVLVAGPHHLDLLTAIGHAAGSVDVLVRSAMDAETIASALEDSKIICGGLDRLEGSPEYDVVVALDGVSRLFGPDSNDLPWQQSVGALRAQLRPGGRLLLAVGNSLGLDSLISAQHTGAPTDEAWPRTVDVEPPAGLSRITTALGVGPRYAVYPDAAEPKLAVDAGLLAEHPGDTLLKAMIGSSTDPAEAFTDPGRAMRDVLDHGLGLQLATAWWFLLGPAPAGLPAVLVAEPGADDRPMVLALDRQDDGQWTRRVVSGAPGRARDLPGDVDVPAGPLLEDRLLAACRWDDQEALLRLAVGYVEWLRTTDQPLFAVPDNVVVVNDRSFAVLDPAWRSTLSPATDLIAVRNLTRYAVRQLAAGVRSPWPAGAQPEQLVTRLAATAGITCDEALFEEAVKLDAEIAAEAGPRFAAAADAAMPQGLREATATITRLSDEIEDLRGQVDWLDVTVNRIRGSRAYRVGGMVLRPATRLRALTRRRPGKDS